MYSYTNIKTYIGGCMIVACRSLALLIILISTVSLHGQLTVRWGVSERQGRRPTMEDAYLAQPDMRSVLKKNSSAFHRHDKLLQEADAHYVLFGIFDGHNGFQAAHFAAQKLPYIYALLSAQDVVQLMQATFKTIHEHIIRQMEAGTTAVVALLRRSKLYLAWAGDARAVLESNGAVSYATRDHKPNDPTERAAIEKRGGRVMNVNGVWRVDGNLAIARALGDRTIAKHITAIPDVHVIQLDSTNSFLILACDGIWDVLSSQEAVDIVRNALKLYKTTAITPIKRQLRGEKITEDGDQQAIRAARALIDAAYQKGSGDNLSAMILLFDWQEQSAGAGEQKIILQTYWQWLLQKLKAWFGY